MRSRASVTHRTASPAPTPPVQAVSKSKKQPAPAAAQPSGEAATTPEENA